MDSRFVQFAYNFAKHLVFQQRRTEVEKHESYQTRSLFQKQTFYHNGSQKRSLYIWTTICDERLSTILGRQAYWDKKI